MKRIVKSFLRSAGVDVSRLSSLRTNRNQPADDPFVHQKRLARTERVEVIFDIGANRGVTTHAYRHWFPDANIYCFEPFDSSFAVLADTFKECSLVHPFQLAVSDAVGMQSFHCTNDTVMNSLLPLSPHAKLLTDSSGVRTIQVQTTTLDAFCDAQKVSRVDIMKIDVQGGELHVLRGAAGLLDQQRVRMIYVEVNFNELYVDQAFFQDVAALLHRYGYILYGLYQIAYSRMGPIGWADALFVSPSLLAEVRAVEPNS